MGNNCCLLTGRKDLSQWVLEFKNNRKSWKCGSFISRINHNIKCSKLYTYFERKCHVQQHLPAYKCNLKEYMTWALENSRASLLFDDNLSRSSMSSHPDDIHAPLTSSWISDGAPSDASHILYRELDPFNKVPLSDSEIKNGTITASTPKSSGNLVAVRNSSNNKYSASSSVTHYLVHQRSNEDVARKSTDNSNYRLIDEEVDGLELTRLGRKLFSHKYQNSKYKNNNDNYESKVAPAVSRPTILNLRPITEPQFSSIKAVNSINAPRVESADSNNDVDLAWDHELELDQFVHPTTINHDDLTFSNKRFEQPSIVQTQPNLFPSRTRRYGQNQLSNESNMVKQQSRNGDTISDPANKHWSNKALIPCSNLLNCSPTKLNANTARSITTTTVLACEPDSLITSQMNLLEDSGFVGTLSNDNGNDLCNEHDDTVVGTHKNGDDEWWWHGINESNDFVWEHDIIDSTDYKKFQHLK